MSQALIEIFGAAGILAIAVVLIESAAAGARPSSRGWPSIIIGLGLLTAAGLATISDRPDLGVSILGLEDPALRTYVRDFVAIGGGLCFVVGVLRRVMRSSARQQLRELGIALGKTSQELTSTQALLTSIVRSSISGVMILQAIRDHAGNIIDFECRLMNNEAEQLLGRSAGSLVGQPLVENLPCIKNQGLLQEGVAAIETKLPFRDERSCKHGGQSRWYQIIAVKHGDGLVVSFADVSDRKRTEEQLRHAAEHDTLTGLPSRSLLSDRLAQAISRARRLPDYKFAVLFLDFDRFKIINDSLGHDVGDQLLISISERLGANLREIDTPSRVDEGHLPARLGGDEFVVLLDGINDARDAVIVAERLQKALSKPHMIGDHEVISTASIGIVTSDGNYERPDDVIRDADTAMYQAKNSGRARHVVFDERMHNEVMDRLNLEKELRQAAKEQQFTLSYQPIVSLETAALVGFEALIRWPHAERGIVLPADFIGLAEELGLIVPIGEWVLREACGQLRRWQQKRPDLEALSMSVNLSKHQLTHPDLVKTITQVIKKTGIEPRSLILEVTESAIMENADDLTPVLSELQDAGVRLAMDDFGTGHSSLGFLHRAPMDILKIDRSFIHSPGKTKDYGAIIQTVVQLAHTLKMQVIAEGIETQEQLVLLQSLDCNLGQGFLFSEPLETEAAERLLVEGYLFTVAA